MDSISPCCYPPKTWSHLGFPLSCECCHLCLLIFMTKLEVLLLEIEARPLVVEWKCFLIAPPICCLLNLNLPLSLSCSFEWGKSFSTVGVQPKILYRSEVKWKLDCWRRIHLTSGEVPCVELYFGVWVWKKKQWWDTKTAGEDDTNSKVKMEDFIDS